MSHEVWIARDGDERLFQYHQKPEYNHELQAYEVPPEKFCENIHRGAFLFIKTGECVRFVPAERFVNGEPVSDGETIPVRIAVVANEKREWSAAGWYGVCADPPSESDMFDNAEVYIQGDNLSRTIVVTRVPVPRVTEVQGVVEGTVQ